MTDQSNPFNLPKQEAQGYRELFLKPFNEHSQLWDDIWQRPDPPFFDQKRSNPALEDLLEQRKDLVGGPMTDGGRRKRALIPGCGRGYDVMLLSSYGYDACGLEVSDNAIRACGAYLNEAQDSYADRSGGAGKGSVSVVKGDFYSNEWLNKVNGGEDGFNFIYDYTFFCAMPPEQRPDWALRMSQLLGSDPKNRLVCLEYPLRKDPLGGGPPFGMNSETYVAHLTKPGERVPYNDKGYATAQAVSGPPSAAHGRPLKRLDHWHAVRTNDSGKGNDWISVWGLE